MASIQRLAAVVMPHVLLWQLKHFSLRHDNKQQYDFTPMRTHNCAEVLIFILFLSNTLYSLLALWWHVGKVDGTRIHMHTHIHMAIFFSRLRRPASRSVRMIDCTDQTKCTNMTAVDLPVSQSGDAGASSAWAGAATWSELRLRPINISRACINQRLACYAGTAVQRKIELLSDPLFTFIPDQTDNHRQTLINMTCM